MTLFILAPWTGNLHLTPLTSEWLYWITCNIYKLMLKQCFLVILWSENFLVSPNRKQWLKLFIIVVTETCAVFRNGFCGRHSIKDTYQFEIDIQDEESYLSMDTK